MKREFVVIDENGNVSYDTKEDQPESFRSFKAARARAEGIAASAPGQSIKIFELTAESLVPIKPVVTSRKHPAEHYQ